MWKEINQSGLRVYVWQDSSSSFSTFAADSVVLYTDALLGISVPCSNDHCR